jgi:hypothetical protein
MMYLRLVDMGKPIYVETDTCVAWVIMGRLDLDVDDELEEKFRAKVYQRKGMKKGNLTDSLEEAIVLWMSTEPTTQGKKPK